MLHGLDHAVILVADLDTAIDDYTRLGFSVVPGGRHDVGTHNALIAFHDGAYIELIAFWEDAPQHRWHRFRDSDAGLIDYCMRTSELAADVAALREAGIEMSEKQAMSRLRPDGYRLEWALSVAGRTQGVSPFLIEDYTPREERVPRQTDHANGVTGVAAVTIAVRELGVAQHLASVLGEERPLDGGEPGSGVRYVCSAQAFDFVTASGDAEVAAFLDGRGGEGGVYALSLRTQGAHAAIEPSRAQNARLRLAGG